MPGRRGNDTRPPTTRQEAHGPERVRTPWSVVVTTADHRPIGHVLVRNFARPKAVAQQPPGTWTEKEQSPNEGAAIPPIGPC